MPQLRLLSKPSIKRDDTWQPLPRGKSSALLYYLAYQGDWVTRDELLYLFWPDTTDKQARSNLRSLLSRSIGKLSYISLDTENDNIRWQVNSDIASFHKALQANNIAQAIDLYTGELLQGYHCADALAFTSWLDLERAELLRLYKDKAASLVNTLMMDEDYKSAVEVLKKVLAQDPFDEISFRHYLKAIFLSEGQPKAEQVFTKYQKDLDLEFGSEPETMTFTLFDELCRSGTQFSTAIAVKVQDKVLHNLPLKLTPFIGRQQERDTLAALLADPRVRLLTIVAPGGMGKTRLAIAVAEEHIGSFADGVYFVPFETLENPDNLHFQIAESLNFKFSGKENPKEQLFSYLKEKEVILVTDNLEHLLDGVTFLSKLLEQSPATKVLATSRELLNLQAEHIFELTGLEHTKAGHESEAIRLFVQSAQQRDKHFELTAKTKEFVAQICELVAGMPLALELAASWLRALTLEDIIQELKQSIDILESQSRDRPDRQHSIRTIFDYSWSLLSKQEQEALASLAVFHGGFTREAAKEVAHVSVPLLLGLCNKSFLRKETDGRYTQHPLMWQYCRENYALSNNKATTDLKHSKFYFSYLGQQTELDLILETRPILHAIDVDFANIKVAWAWAVEHKDEALLDAGVLTLLDFFRYENRYNDGISLFKSAVDRLKSESIVHAKLYFALGLVLGLQDVSEKTIVNLHKSIELAKNHGDENLETRVLNFLSVHYNWLGQLKKNREILESCNVLAKKVGEDYFYAWTVSKMSMQQDKTIDETIALANEGISLLEKCNGYFALGHASEMLSFVLQLHKGHYQKALQLMESAIKIERMRGWKSRVVRFLTLKASISVDLGRLEQAEQSVSEAQLIKKDLEQSFGVSGFSNAYVLLAKVKRIQGDYSVAKEQLLLAFETLEQRSQKGRWYLDDYVEYAYEGTKLALSLDDLTTAKVYLTEVETKLKGIDNVDEFYTLNKMRAELAIALQDVKVATKYLKVLFHTVNEREQLPDILDVFITYAQTLILKDKVSEALPYLHYVETNASSRFEAKLLARQILSSLDSQRSDVESTALETTDFDQLNKQFASI